MTVAFAHAPSTVAHDAKPLLPTKAKAEPSEIAPVLRGDTQHKSDVNAHATYSAETFAHKAPETLNWNRRLTYQYAPRYIAPPHSVDEKPMSIYAQPPTARYFPGTRAIPKT